MRSRLRLRNPNRISKTRLDSTLLDLSNDSLGTFTRTSSGSYLEFGDYQIPQGAGFTTTNGQHIERVGPNVRRFETRTADGPEPILLEGSSTNLLLRSEEFDHADWTKEGSAVVTSSVSSFGELNLDRIEDPDNQFASIRQNGVTIISGAQYTVSCFFEKGFTDVVELRATQQSIGAQFDNAGNTAWRTNSGDASGMEDLGSVWRAWFIYTSNRTSEDYRLIPAVDSTPADGGLNFNSTGFVNAGGYQVEQSPFPTSYIKTTSTTATRAKDSLTFTAGEFPEQIRSGRFTFDWYPYYTDTVDSGGRVCLFQQDGNQLNGFRFRPANKSIEWIGASGAIVAAGPITFSRHQKITVTCDQQAGSLTVEGATTGNGTYTGTPDPWDSVTMDMAGTNGLNDQAFQRISNIRKA